MTILQAIILGIVEGVTEYLPVSSTGHLILTAWLLGLGDTPEEKKAIDAFNVIVQGGAILAVAGLYWPRMLAMVRGLLGRDAPGLRLFTRLLAAFIPAAILGLLLDDLISAHLFRPVPVLAALLVGGIVLILSKRWQAALLVRQSRGADGGDPAAVRFKSIEDLTLRDAFLIGCLQCVAMWPGTSRSMMTILGGLFVGLPPARAAEFSFLVGLPTLLGACVLTLAKQLREHGLSFVDPLGGWTPVLVGIATATIAAAISIRWLVGYLSRHSLAIFGWWRIAVAIVLGAMLFGGGMTL